jgi:hypothetical protein
VHVQFALETGTLEAKNSSSAILIRMVLGKYLTVAKRGTEIVNTANAVVEVRLCFLRLRAIKTLQKSFDYSSRRANG